MIRFGVGAPDKPLGLGPPGMRGEGDEGDEEPPIPPLRLRDTPYMPAATAPAANTPAANAFLLTFPLPTEHVAVAAI